MVVDTVTFMNKQLKDPSRKILVEGANALMLDIDFGEFIGHNISDHFFFYNTTPLLYSNSFQIQFRFPHVVE